MLQDTGRLRRRRSDDHLSLDIRDDEEERKPLLSSRIELLQYRSIERFVEEEKVEYKSLYIPSDEKIIVIPFSQLERFKVLLKALIQQQSRCGMRLVDYCCNKVGYGWYELKKSLMKCLERLPPAPFLFFVIITIALDGLGHYLFWGKHQSLIQAAKLSLQNWKTLLSRNSNLTCAIAYNSVAECIRVQDGYFTSATLRLVGLSKYDDPICYNALDNLCKNNCEWSETQSNMASNCISNGTSGFELLLFIFSISISLFPMLCCMFLQSRDRNEYSRFTTRQEGRLSHFFTIHHNLFEETKITYDINRSAENLLQQTENEIKHVYFFKNRRQLVAEKLPIYEKHKANLAEIVDEYLGIAIC